jgi:methyl-accepting chemotaxis protein
VLIALEPIYMSNGLGSPQGILIMGRYLDAAKIDKLSETTDLQISFQEISSSPGINTSNWAKGPGQETPILINSVSKDFIAGSTLINDIYKRPVLIMKVTMSRDIYRHGEVSAAYLMIILAVVGLVFSILLIWVLEKDILSRVRWLDFQVSDIGRTGDLSRRISIKGKDELMELAAAINRMIKQVQDSQRELQVANESLKQLDVMKSDFLSMVSHELRTPSYRYFRVYPAYRG